MRTFLLSLAVLALAAISSTHAAEPFEIKDGDRVLFLGDTLLEREGTYGYLETRMVEQFPDRRFTVRNLAFSADTPLGWSRASFDPPAKGFERLKEQLALVKPTVVFLGYGMAASLQEMTDRSQDWTLNRDPARYGAEPMSAARFKKELAQCMDAIQESGVRGQESGKTPAANLTPDSRPLTPAPVRFVLLSPIKHEDLRDIRPGLPDPTEHNKLLEQYSSAIRDLAKERDARFVDCYWLPAGALKDTPQPLLSWIQTTPVTENGIHFSEAGYRRFAIADFSNELGWYSEIVPEHYGSIRAAIIRKNALFFHRWRPANETYLFGFRKREQGQNAVEIPKFDPLIEAAEAEIERLKKSAGAAAPVNPSNDERRAWGRVGVPPAGSRVPREPSNVEKPPQRDAPSANARTSTSDGLGETPGPAGGTPTLPEARQSASANAATPDPATPPDLTRQTAAEKPDLSKIPAQSKYELPTFTLADGLEISLWAENPLLAKPTECNWDAQGRLWVASSAMYPQIAPGQAAFDKIIVLEDPGHTGKATKATVFADGLLIPTGVAPVLVSSNQSSVINNQKPAADRPLITDSPITDHSAPRWACYVGQSTELLYFEDTDGDGKADKKRIVFSGFGTEDTHHIVHTLRWGPDGRLYFSQSVYIHTHMETPWGVVRVNSGGVFAYDPRTERVEVVEKGLWNTWGHAWDQWGQSFYTDGAGSTGLSWGFHGATFAPSEGARRTMASISPGSYPKFAGLELIYSPHFPAEWQGTAVTCDFRAHKIVHFKINDLGNDTATRGQGDKVKEGSAASVTQSPPYLVTVSPKSGYTTEQLPVLVQTSDATFRPIDVKLGPDGAIYIADWSNPIINHGEVDFRDPRRDHEHGRIWRLSMKGGAAVKWSDLNKLSGAELIRQMKSGSLWAVAHARPILEQRYPVDSATASAIHDWIEKASGDDHRKADDSQAVLDGFWIQNRHARDSTTLYGLLYDPTPSARAIAARFLGGIDDFTENVRGSLQSKGVSTEKEPHVKPMLARDPHPRVRIEAMRALARIPNIEHASLILDAAINAPKDDPQYEFAAWLSINDLAEVWTEAVLAGKWKIEGREKQLEFALDALDAARSGPVIAALLKERPITRDGAGPWIELIGKGGGKAELQQLFARVAKGELEPPALVRAMNALADAARLRNVRPDGDVAMVVTLIDAVHPDTRAAAARLAGLWKIPEAAPRLEALAKNADAAERAAAFEGLRSLGGAPAVAALQKLVRSENPAVPPAALAALAQLKPAAAIAEIPAVLGAIKSEPELLATWRGIFQSTGAVDLLAANFPANLPKPAITAALRAARELGRNGQRLVAKLMPLAGESAESIIPADFADLAARAKKDGDPVAGEALYRRTASACTACHAIGGAGGKLGPEMTSIGASAPPDYIIESLLNPAAKVKEGYHAFSFTMKDGTEAIGIPTRETPQEQFIRTLAGEQGLPKANIVSKKIAEGGATLMPAGLTAAWSDRERLNLYAFLMELGRPGPFDASKNNVARMWLLSDSGKVEGALKPEKPATTVPSMPVYTLVDGRLTKDLLAEKLAMLAPKNEAVHLTAWFQAATAGKAKLNLTGIRKAWLDGQPLAIASEPSPSVELTAGAHTFTVEVDAKSPPEVVRLESAAASFLGD